MIKDALKEITTMPQGWWGAIMPENSIMSLELLPSDKSPRRPINTLKSILTILFAVHGQNNINIS